MRASIDQVRHRTALRPSLYAQRSHLGRSPGQAKAGLTHHVPHVVTSKHTHLLTSAANYPQKHRQLVYVAEDSPSGQRDQTACPARAASLHIPMQRGLLVA